MEDVLCKCQQCGSHLGQFLNLWAKIGGRYVSPIVLQTSALQVDPQGESRVGEKETLVADCELQDICCSQCHNLVGLECLETPLNHVLAKGQFLLRLSSVSLVSHDNDAPLELIIVRNLRLKATGSTRHAAATTNEARSERSYDASSAGDQDFSEIQADLEAQREDIDRLDNAGLQIISAFNEAVTRIDREVNTLKGTSRDYKRDVNGVSDDISSLKSDLKGVKKTIGDTTVQDRHETQLQSTTSLLAKVEADLDKSSKAFRKELSSIRNDVQQSKKTVEDLKSSSSKMTATSKEQAKDIATLRAELKQLRRQVEDGQSHNPRPTNYGPSSKEIEILQNNINSLRPSVAQVETIQMGFDLLKGRVERLEGQGHNSDDRLPAHRLRGPPDATYEKYQTVTTRSDARARRKRPVPSNYDSEESPHKRVAFSSDSNATPRNEYELPASSSPPPPDVNSDWAKASPRMTKSGNVDKRFLRRDSKRPRGR